MAFSSRSWYDMQGLTPLTKCLILWAMRLLYKFRRDMLQSIWNRLIGSFYGRYGDLIKQYEVPFSQMSHGILGHDHVQWLPPLIRHHSNSWPCYRIGDYYLFLLFNKMFRDFHRSFATSADNLRTPGPAPFGTCICCYDETIQCLLKLSSFRTFGLWFSGVFRYFWFYVSNEFFFSLIFMHFCNTVKNKNSEDY